tara:strand:- start:316 stop:1206 length:891 start_codon:yes stop_codon:yes gene_type:complete
LDKLNEIITNDGSISLKSEFYNESFHSHLGALNEAQTKFIDPARIDRFRGKSLNVLDICFGLGYNSALLFKNIKRQSSSLRWYGLEIDKRPLKYALSNESFKALWDKKTIDILNSLLISGFFKDENHNCDLLWEDARKGILKIPQDINFDVIFLDGFSPQKCPEIWSAEFLAQVIGKLNSEGSLLTYSSSAAVRKTFLDLKLRIFNIKPVKKNNKSWSSGTLAIRSLKNNEFKDNPYIENLSNMQIEHLHTKSSVPYRDPKGINKSEEILKRRKDEQTISTLKDTNLWRKKWDITN